LEEDKMMKKIKKILTLNGEQFQKSDSQKEDLYSIISGKSKMELLNGIIGLLKYQIMLMMKN